jgi:S-DNA-T family DNA segregation ATPase FtsK/SpoIIIE
VTAEIAPAAADEDEPSPIVDAEIVDLPPRPELAVPDQRTQVLPPPWAAEPAERRPVVATWLRDAQQRRQAARWDAGYVGHLLAFHAVRIPLYVLRALVFIPRGALRLLGRVIGGRPTPAPSRCSSPPSAPGTRRSTGRC